MALTFTDAQARALLEPLGLAVDTDDPDTVVATVVDALAADGLANAAPSAIVAAAAKAGLEVLDSDTAAALRADAAEGRRIQAAVQRQQVEDAVNAAIAKGKITPARREHWVNLITADPGMGEVLAAVPDETAVPINEIGHGVSNEDHKNISPDGWDW
ncbi:MAG: hypothetical protein WCZ29_08575 [Mycolicibacterium vanbaalenii]|jgi:hypothetical protein|uniref:hypothetical protein n=1 Tax=Mycolicibacterium vanbaalenii TaxID=110539 RepID=UPI003565795B